MLRLAFELALLNLELLDNETQQELRHAVALDVPFKHLSFKFIL